MIVMKFGGTSVGSAKAIDKVYEIVKTQVIKNKDSNIFVVLSAVGGVTNILVELINNLKETLSKEIKYINIIERPTQNTSEIIENIRLKHFEIINELTLILISKNNTNSSEFKEKSLEYLHLKLEKLQNICKSITILQEISIESEKLILSFGEFISTEIVSNYFEFQTNYSKLIDITEYLVYDLNESNQNEIIKFQNTSKILEYFSDNSILITQGFIAKNLKDEITNLGRGGSDYSAALIASEFNADELQIWTDVSGIKTGDPRIIQDTKTIKEIDFETVSLMAYWGAKVLHPKTILPTIKRNIPTKILNTFDNGLVFTTIVSNKCLEEFNESSIIIRNNLCFLINDKFIPNLDYLLFKNFENKYIYILESSNQHLLDGIDTSENLEKLYTIIINNINLNKFLKLSELIKNNLTIFCDLELIKIFEFDSYNQMLILGLNVHYFEFEKLLELANDLHKEINNFE